MTRVTIDRKTKRVYVNGKRRAFYAVDLTSHRKLEAKLLKFCKRTGQKPADVIRQFIYKNLLA